MSYDAIERSDEQGQPVELYTFSRGTLVWLFTSADLPRTVDSQTFATVRGGIRRPSIAQGAELNRQTLKLAVPRDFPIVTLFRGGVPSDPIVLRIQQYHESDGEVIGVWGGRVVNAARMGSMAELACEPVYTSVRSVGLRRKYQRMCPHVLYGPSCRLDAADFRLSTTTETVAGAVVTSADFATQPDGYWEGGWLEWEIATGIFERRFISGHTADSLELMTQPVGLLPGTSVNVYPGCDHTLATCGDKFANRDNYGGMPDIPQKNPFGSDPVY